jgi:endonuclease/exonuclease/phosphatase family metal-dependent hydrolase
MHHGEISAEIAKGLKELRKRIAKSKIPSSEIDETLNLTTWNIRKFGQTSRKTASLHYIAEIMGQFDLIAVTELQENLEDLSEVLKILGPYWRAVYSDFIKDQGNAKERMAYVFDKRAVSFTGLAAEADAPRKKMKNGEWIPEFSWWRSPYIASFRSGNFDFVLITAHIRWGSGKKARIKPLKLLAEWIHDRRENKFTADQDIILLGDFNIPKLDDDLFKAITSQGLDIPAPLRGLEHGSNLAKNKRYDQILHYPVYDKKLIKKAGILNFFAGGEEGIKKLFPNENLGKTKFTYQLSDHLPLWVQLDTDIDGEQLDQIINPKKGVGVA